MDALNHLVGKLRYNGLFRNNINSWVKLPFFKTVTISNTGDNWSVGAMQEYNTITYLSTKRVRSLIYRTVVTMHDTKTPLISTQVWIKSLNYSIVNDWRPCGLSMVKLQLTEKSLAECRERERQLPFNEESSTPDPGTQAQT